MDIRIKSIRLINFKGLRDTFLEFDGHDCRLDGANATGKTTVFDAFTWALFGKDSKGATQFEIKTLTEAGEVMWQLPHVVTIELLIDGRVTTIRREHTEEWSKTKGGVEESFRGHRVDRFWNDVPCTAAEFDMKVAALCEESLFRLITNPMYFNSLDDREKMRMLNQLEGNTTDDQFMAATPQFADFLQVLDGKTLDEYKRELTLKTGAVNKEIAQLHTRLDEVARNEPTAEDWKALEAQLANCTTEIGHLRNVQTDLAKRSEEQGKIRLAIQASINAEKTKIQARENAIGNAVNAEYYAAKSARNELTARASDLNREIASKQRNAETLAKRREALTQRMEVLRGAYRTIKAEAFDFDPQQGVCPTCGQKLPSADVEERRARLEANFNTDKANRLTANIADGTNVSEELKSIEQLIAQTQSEIRNLQEELAKVNDDPRLQNELPAVDVRAAFEQDELIVAARDRIAQFERELAQVPQSATNEEYATRERELQATKTALEKRLFVRTVIAQAEQRTQEIEASIRTNGQQLLSLQHDAEIIAQIQKEKALYVESRINSAFELVRFKMIDAQVNGGERQVCETTVGGVPYFSLNNAARINAGLDIIRAFSRYHGVEAPIFVDNAEACNSLLEMDAQVIALYVTNDKKLTLKS